MDAYPFIEPVQGEDYSDLGAEESHPRGCRNGWLDVDVECPVCAARPDDDWPTAEDDPDLRAFGPGLMHTQRINASIQVNRGTGGVECPRCHKPEGEFCFGGTIPPYPGSEA